MQNKPGAGGAIGFAELARAVPDGYTIGFINTPNLLTIPIERKTPFTWKSYDLIGSLVDDPGAFTVNQSSHIDSLATLVKYAKKNRVRSPWAPRVSAPTTTSPCCCSRRLLA